MGTLIVRDEAVAGQTLHEFALDFLTEDITVRELIERRVYEEVQTYNTSQPGYFRGLVQPTDAEATLNGYINRANAVPECRRGRAHQHRRRQRLRPGHQAARGRGRRRLVV